MGVEAMVEVVVVLVDGIRLGATGEEHWGLVGRLGVGVEGFVGGIEEEMEDNGVGVVESVVVVVVVVLEVVGDLVVFDTTSESEGLSAEEDLSAAVAWVERVWFASC
jgi:hypothetical protein